MLEAKIVDLFCGAGGLTAGLEAAGLNVVEGVDADELCRYPYETNTQFRAWHETCRMVSIYFDKEWQVESLGEVYRRDGEEWQHPAALLHVGTLESVLMQICERFPALVRRSVESVTGTHKELLEAAGSGPLRTL